MKTARRLPWTERQTLSTLLESLAEHFPARQDFEVWRAGLLGGFIAENVHFVGVYEEESLEGGVLLQGQEGYWMVLAVVGELEGEALRRAFELMTAEASLVLWDDAVGEGWASALAELGARGYCRQTFVQDLEAVVFKPVPEDGLVLAAWDEGRQAAALELLARGNAGTLGGMFLTAPRPPSYENCRAGFEQALAGVHGEFLPWASFMALDGEAVRGAILCVQGEHPRQGLLFELFVSPEARGRQLSRRLVQAMQQALLARGYSQNHFLTTDENAPVHRLFTLEEIERTEEVSGGYWVR